MNRANAAARSELIKALRNPPWAESIPLAALEAMEKAARALEAPQEAAPPPPLFFVATYGESTLSGGFADCLLGVQFFESPLAYGRAVKAAGRLHDAGRIDSYTMGDALAPSVERARHAAALAKARRRVARAAKAAALAEA